MRDTETLVDLYRQMYTIRAYNEVLREKFEEGASVPSGIHGAKGQEAPAVGVCHQLRDDDWVFTYHRSLHTAIAKGVDLRELAAEQLGKQGGMCDGKAGEQHIFDGDANFVSGAIVAQQLPSATGVALAQKRRDTGNVVVGFLGDGAANQGAFYECLNFASVHDLPIVFVIEDNELGISTPRDQVTAVDDNSERAAGQDMPGRRVEDNDVRAVADEAAEAIARARRGEGPTLLAVRTCRMMGHFFADPDDYREAGAFEQMEADDCMPKIVEALRERGVAEAELERIRDAVEPRVRDAVEYALDQPHPDPDLATRDVFADANGGVER
jgi:pyruvate dehydrogenase E1 component alpha subunit